MQLCAHPGGRSAEHGPHHESLLSVHGDLHGPCSVRCECWPSSLCVRTHTHTHIHTHRTNVRHEILTVYLM